MLGLPPLPLAIRFYLKSLRTISFLSFMKYRQILLAMLEKRKDYAVVVGKLVSGAIGVDDVEGPFAAGEVFKPKSAASLFFKVS